VELDFEVIVYLFEESPVLDVAVLETLCVVVYLFEESPVLDVAVLETLCVVVSLLEGLLVLVLLLILLAGNDSEGSVDGIL
jgi:hypothetical protein